VRFRPATGPIPPLLAMLFFSPRFVAVADGAPAADSLLAAEVAPDPRGALTLAAAAALARRHHPAVRDLAWRVRASEARRRDAGRPPNPTLGLDIENVGGSLGSRHREVTVRAEQVVELGGKRSARARAAAAQVSLARAELSEQEWTVLVATGRRFLEAWALQERTDRLARAERLAEQAVAAAGERHRAGAGPAVERVRAEALHALRQSERVRARAELTIARHGLAAQWGAATAAFDSLVLEPPGAARIPAHEVLAVFLNEHPERRRAAAAVEWAQARLREARAARAPDVSLSAGARHLAEADATGFLAGISLPLPLWNGQRGAVMAADAERHAVQAREQLVRLRLDEELRAARERLLAAIETHRTLEARVLPGYEDALGQIAAGYRAGRFNALEYLEAQRNLLDTELAVIEARVEAWSAQLDVEAMVGRSLDEIQTPGEGR
jgi:cobalt-zinc-cadmium efflux system outer membrane protein